MARYDKIRDAAGGDDFTEFVPAKSLTALEPGCFLEIELTADKMTISVVRPTLEPMAEKKSKRIHSSPDVAVYPSLKIS